MPNSNPHQHIWNETVVNSEAISTLKEKANKMETTLEKFMERMEEKIDDLTFDMNRQFSELRKEIAQVSQKQITLESKMKGGWWIICALGALIVGAITMIGHITNIVR